MADGYEQLHEYLGPDGTEYRVSSAREEEFLKAVPDARRFARHVGKDGTVYRVGPDKVDSFRAENPDAEPVYPMRTAKGVESIRARDVAGFVSRMAPKAPQTGKGIGRDLLDVAVGHANNAGYSILTAAPEALGALFELGGYVDPRSEEGRLEQAVTGRQQLGNRIVGFGNRAREWREGMLRAPETTAGEVADPILGTGAELAKWIGAGKLAEAGRLANAARASEAALPAAQKALPAGFQAAKGATGAKATAAAARATEAAARAIPAPDALMGAGGFAESVARTRGREDLTPEQRAALAIAGGLSQQAVFGAPGARVVEGVQQAARTAATDAAAALVGPRNAARIVERAGTDAAGRIAQRLAPRAVADATRMGLASAAGDIAAAEPVDLGRAAQSAGAGAIIGSTVAGVPAAAAEAARGVRGARVRAAERAVSKIAEEADRAEALRAARERTARAEEARAQMEETTEREGEDPALYERIGEQYDAAERAEAERRRAADAERMARVAAEEELAGAVAPEVAPEEVPPQVPSRRTLASERAARAAQGEGPGRTPIEMPDPSQTPATEALPTTPEQIQERRREQVDAMPTVQRNKHLGMKRYAAEFPERTLVLDAIGWDKFQQLSKKYGGDFRNVTGDLVPVGEISEATGRDYSGPDGVRRALEDAQAEADAWRSWREKGAPSAEEEMAEGQEISYNKDIQSEAQERYRERAAENQTGANDPAARDAAIEEEEIARAEAEGREEPVAGSTTPPQSANISRRYTAKPLVFQKPIVGPSGARIVSYNWTNKPVEYVDERGEDRVKRVSDWDYSNENEDTGRQIVHSFVVEMPDGTSRAVSAESAAKALGYPVGKFKTEALREIRQAMLVDSLPAEQVAGFVEALGRSTRGGARNAYPIYKQTDKVSILKDGTIRIVGNRKADGIADRWPVVITTVSPDGTIKTERLNAWPTTKGKAISADAIAKRAQAPAPVAGPSTPPRDFALDGGTPAEIDAEKARAAEAQKRAALEEAAAAPGRDLGTVSIQEGLPGIGGDGTLFTPPAGGWSGRVASGPLADAPKQHALADAVKDAADWVASRGKKPGGASGAPAAPAARLDGMLAADRGSGDLSPERAQEYRALAEEASRAGLYRTAARALARIGEFRGEAFETLEAEGGAPARTAGASSPEARRLLPEAEAGSPALQRLGVGDLVGFVKDALGQVPGVRRILMNGRALGLFRPGAASAALSGMRDRGARAIEVMSKLYQVLPEGEKARIAQDAERAAAREARPGDTPEEREARLARWTQKLTDEAWHRHLREGPTAAANVLAHEIGHFVDFLPDRDLGRGNILGHIAGMKKYLRNYLAIDPALQPGEGAPDAALFPEKERARIAKDARDAVSRLPGESAEAWKARRDEAAREAVGEEALRRGLARRADVEREIDDLVAWYNTSDGPPDYFKGNATERFAEAFSALVNYPEVARLKAPRLAKLMDEWAAARPEAARALVRARERAARLQARMIRTGKSQPDEGFFKELRESTAAQSEARRRISEIRREQGRWNAREFSDWARAWFVGRFEPVFKRIREAGGWNDETAAKAWGSVNRLSHWANGGDLILYRWRSEVAPLVAKVKGGLEAFDEFLINWRVANEVLGESREGGRVNLANPEGLTPGDFTGPHAEAGRTAAARLKAIRERDPEQWNALMAAREAFWKMRTDRDSSVIPALRRSGLMPESALRQLEANSAYVRFKRGVRASDYDPRPLASRAKDAMSTWSGVYRQVQGTHGAIESPTLATLMGDAEILRRVALNEARRDVAALMQRHFPNLVRPGMPAGRGGRVDQRMDRHMRTLVWSEDGKQRSLEVPRHIADALEDASAGLGGDAGGGPVVDALRSFARTESALMTAWNYGFAVKNVVRDKADMARAMPGKDWNSARNWLSNILGDFGAAAHSALQRAGRDRRLGRANLSVVEALESGAMPAGQGTAWATGKRFAEEVGDLLASADTADHERAVRAIMEAAGYDPSLRTEEAAVRKAARAFSKVYQKGLEVLSDQETNNKVQAMLEIRRAHPDWSPDRVAWYVQRYVGTPDPTDRPRVTEYPVFNMLVPFWTMNVHGNHDQLVRLAAEQKGVQAARFAAHTAAKWAANFSAPMLLRWAARKREEGDEEAAAMAEDAAEMQRSIPIHDRLSGICIPLAWADRKAGKVWYVRIPSGQTIVPVDALVLGSQAAARKQTPWGDVADWSLGSMMPVNPGPPVKAAVGALSGVDIGTGFRKISAEAAGPGEIALDRALFFLRQLGVNGAGLANGKMPWAKEDVGESVGDLERALRMPGLNATLGSFLRVSNGGRKGEARVTDAENRRRSARVTRASDRIAAGEGTDEDYATLYELSGDADRAVTNAERRRDRREEEPDPLRRALLRVPEEFREAEAARHRMPSP